MLTSTDYSLILSIDISCLSLSLFVRLMLSLADSLDSRITANLEEPPYEACFDRVYCIANLCKWIASDPICIDLYTCLGNDTPIMPPPNRTSPNDYVIQAVAYRALQCYFRLDNSFLEEAQERMLNLSLSTAVGAIVHDAR